MKTKHAFKYHNPYLEQLKDFLWVTLITILFFVSQAMVMDFYLGKPI